MNFPLLDFVERDFMKKALRSIIIAIISVANSLSIVNAMENFDADSYLPRQTHKCLPKKPIPGSVPAVKTGTQWNLSFLEPISLQQRYNYLSEIAITSAFKKLAYILKNDTKKEMRNDINQMIKKASSIVIHQTDRSKQSLQQWLNWVRGQILSGRFANMEKEGISFKQQDSLGTPGSNQFQQQAFNSQNDEENSFFKEIEKYLFEDASK